MNCQTSDIKNLEGVLQKGLCLWEHDTTQKAGKNSPSVTTYNALHDELSRACISMCQRWCGIQNTACLYTEGWPALPKPRPIKCARFDDAFKLVQIRINWFWVWRPSKWKALQYPCWRHRLFCQARTCRLGDRQSKTHRSYFIYIALN